MSAINKGNISLVLTNGIYDMQISEGSLSSTEISL
jgi:hypothetical protein